MHHVADGVHEVAGRNLANYLGNSGNSRPRHGGGDRSCLRAGGRRLDDSALTCRSCHRRGWCLRCRGSLRLRTDGRYVAHRHPPWRTQIGATTVAVTFTHETYPSLHVPFHLKLSYARRHCRLSMSRINITNSTSLQPLPVASGTVCP